MEMKLIIVGALIVQLCACVTQSVVKYNINKDITSNPEVFELDLPDEEGVRQYFLEGDDGYVYISTGGILAVMYNRQYKDKFDTYKDMICAALHEGFKLHFEIQDPYDKYGTYADYLERFICDRKIMKDYARLGADGLLRKYTRKNDDGDYEFLISRKKHAARLTIAYCLWKNGFHYVDDGFVAYQVLIRQESQKDPCSGAKGF